MTKFVILSFIIVLSSCSKNEKQFSTFYHSLPKVTNIQELYRQKQKENVVLSDFEKLLLQNNFVAVNSIDTSIVADLRYASENNFLGINMYGSFQKAYLQNEVVHMLIKAQNILRSIDSSCSLIIYDALRPQSIQQLMWDSCSFSLPMKKNFLANPKNTSMHNYGAAVDVTILQNGVPLDMGTAFDDPGESSYTYIEDELLRYGKLSYEQYENRKRLRTVMTLAGFIPNKYEWWHFGACYRKDVARKYPLVYSFDSIKPIHKKYIDDIYSDAD